MSIVFTANTVRPCKELCGTPKSMPAKRSADATQCFQPLQPRTELVEKVDQPNQPKTVGPNRTQPLSHKGSSTGILFGASVLAKKQSTPATAN